MLVSDRENVTEGYQSRPKSILKLRENSTMPIVSGSQRKVSFYNHVELRRFEFTPSLTYSGEESETQYSDLPEVLSSEFDENPKEPSVANEASDSNDIGIDESTNNDDESMELTGQLNPTGYLADQVKENPLNVVNKSNDVTEEEPNNAQTETLITPTANDATPVSRDEPRDSHLLEQFRSATDPARKDTKRLDDDANNISFTMSPHQERQILFLPKMTPDLEFGSENTTAKKQNDSTLGKTAQFRPLEALQDYADSLRDSLFNDTANSSPPAETINNDPDQLDIQATDTERSEAVNEGEVEMELTQQVAVEWTEEVTMELTTQISQPGAHHDTIEKSNVETHNDTDKENNQDTNEKENEDPSEVTRKFTQEETMDFTQPVINRSMPEEEPMAIDKEIDESVNSEPKKSSESNNPKDSIVAQLLEDQEESTMELTTVFQQEAHMLSVVEEEDESEEERVEEEELIEEETEIPMDLTQPIPKENDPNVHKTPSRGSTPPPKQLSINQDGEQIQVDGNIVDRSNNTAPVDTPAIIASQRELNRLIEEPTPNVVRNGVSFGGLGTPMKEPTMPRRLSHSKPLLNDEINLETPFHYLPNHLHFESDFVPKVATTFAKRSLDPAIELKTSPSKRFSAHGTGLLTTKHSKDEHTVPAVSLTTFLRDIEVKFFDDLEVGTDLPAADSPEGIISIALFTNEDYYRANIQIPLLEVYELSCKELKGKISQGKNLYKELQETANQEVPDLFGKYYGSSYYDQMSMKSHFQVVRDYTREQAKHVWYEWRSKLFKNVSEVLSSNLELLIEDKHALEARLQDLQLQLKSTLANLGAHREDIARFHKIQEQYQQLDSKQIQALKNKLLELNKQLLAHREAIATEQNRLQEVNERILNQNDALDNLSRKIDDAKLGLMKLKHLNPDEISVLETKSKIIQACSGLRFRKKHSKYIYEFEFSPKMSITIDMENTHSADGLVFHPIDSGISTLYNDSLERYCQAIAETTPFLTIFETLAVFRLKWLKLSSIDEQIYALSMLYPITIGEYNEQEINFVIHYYSASTDLKVDFTVTISILRILEANTCLQISARVLRSRGKTTEKTLQETLSRQIAPHRIFRGITGLKIIE